MFERKLERIKRSVDNIGDLPSKLEAFIKAVTKLEGLNEKFTALETSLQFHSNELDILKNKLCAQ